MSAPNAIADLQTTIERAAERAGPAVVGLGRGWHSGSGVVVSRGRVLTAAHNVRGSDSTVAFLTGEHTPARIAGVDEGLDLALLAVDTGDIEPVEWPSDGAPVGIGAPVVAVANPGGRGLRATLGFVSAADRSFRGPRGRRIAGCIEHTALLPRGSSGSPVLDSDGRLLGLNAIRLEGGLIVAVPAPRARVDALDEGRQVVPARLGVAVAPPYVARRMRRAVGLPDADGLLVRAVEQPSPASRAGIERGDLIVAAGGRAVEGVDALHEALDEIDPNGTLVLSIVRGTDERELTVSFDDSLAQEEVAQ